MRKFFEYVMDNAWVGEAMYWLGFITLMTCTFDLPSHLYFGAILSGVVMNWGGLIKGACLHKENT